MRNAGYAAVSELDLDVRFEYFEDNFGTFRSVVDACDPEYEGCPDTGDDPLRLYLHETDVSTVRALFEGDTLRAYLVTTTSKEFHPPATWLGHELGELGRTDAATMLAVPGTDLPVETSANWGPQWISYVDVLAPGGPGNYRGLVLAWTPDGVQSVFAGDAAIDVAQAEVEGGDPSAHIDRLRQGTAPNTFGEFRDDGSVGMWLRDPEVVQGLLFLNTEF